MLPDPLHPAVVHFPMALVALIPLLAILAIVAIRSGFVPPRAWLAIVLLQALLVGSSWIALQTGEAEEERVERVVAEREIEAHEDEAERLMVLAGVGLLVSVIGLARGAAGAGAQLATTALALVILFLGVRVGHSGGALVYEHGAASAYVTAGGGAPLHEAEHEEDDDD